jgi:hypothetical protein
MPGNSLFAKEKAIKGHAWLRIREMFAFSQTECNANGKKKTAFVM